jgi:hypothetical protein
MTTRTVRELAAVVRSKNAGPFRLTVDILFKTDEIYRRVVASGAIDREAIGRAYHLEPDEITHFVEFHPGRAIKATFPRPVSSGAFGDTDVYGAQQHAPLLDMAIPWEDESP